MVKPSLKISQNDDLSHALPIEKIFSDFNTSAQGITQEKALANREKYGINQLTQTNKRLALKRLFNALNNTLILVLITAAILTFILGKYLDTSVIIAIVIINTIIAFVQEGKAERAIEMVRKMLSEKATVIRDNEKITIAAKDIVPGDIVFLQSGDKVPADLRLFETKNLKISEAILTGESYPVQKNTSILPENTELLDRSNMAYSGTLVTYGQGTGVVVAIGNYSAIGHISSMLKKVISLETPLIKKMRSFSTKLTYLIVISAFIIFVFGYFLHRYTFDEMFIIAITIAVAAIPEGLPIILTVTLAIGVERMAKRHVIIRRLPAVETLGSVSIICSDKTGTLTQNEITAQFVSLGNKDIHISGVGYFATGDFSINGKVFTPSSHFKQLCKASVISNTAKFRYNPKTSSQELIGDPTEGALLTLAQKAGLDYKELRKQFPLIDSIPFESEHSLMATLNKTPENSQIIFIKGAPETILKRAKFEYDANEKLQPIDFNKWQEITKKRAQNGERVLLIAQKIPSDAMNKLTFSDIEDDLIVLGLVSMIDPPRDEVIDAVKECHQAGIITKMITGDHAITAQAIASIIGITDNDKVLTGTELDNMTDDELRLIIKDVNVFARATPEHKLRIVTSLQNLNYTIAMTGDGVNDAPALKRADIGVAMGHKGTEVAKEASEMVITDDNFASIVKAVKEGRTVFTNLKKAIIFLLPINSGESLSIIIAVLFGLTLPITPLQILWVNMVSSVTLAMSLAFEPHEHDVMHRPPMKHKASFLSKKLIWRIFYVSIVFVMGIFGIFKFAILKGEDIETARTLGVNTLVILEVFYLFSSRYMYGASLTLKGIRGTPAVLWAVSIVAILQLLFTFTPIMNYLFHTRPLNIYESILILVIGVTGFFLFEAEKLLTLNNKQISLWFRRIKFN